MTVKEVEGETGLSRSNIRFYEKEKLIDPSRNEKNGYREYSQMDVEELKKIAYLRTLDISVDVIRKLKEDKILLTEVLELQYQILEDNLEEIQKAKSLCERMIQEDEKSYGNLDVKKYVGSIDKYIEVNNKIIKTDAVTFVSIWCGTAVWGIITMLCLIIALLSISYLPDKIPIQWSKEEVTSTASKYSIFLYSVICILVKFLLRPFIWRCISKNFGCSFDVVTDYVVNVLCFLLLSVEICTILFVAGILLNIAWIILLNGVVFFTMFLLAYRQINLMR